MFIPFKLPAVGGRKSIAGDGEDRPRRQIKKDCFGGRYITERLHPLAGKNTPAEALQVSGQRIGDLLRTASRNRPPARMAERSEKKAKSGCQRRMKGHIGMPGDSAKQSSSTGPPELTASECCRRLDCLKSESKHQ